MAVAMITATRRRFYGKAKGGCMSVLWDPKGFQWSTKGSQEVRVDVPANRYMFTKSNIDM